MLWLTVYKSYNVPVYLIWLYTNSSSPGENGLHFADDIFKGIFVNEMFFVSIQISLNFVPKGPIFKDIFVNEIFCVPIQISLTVVPKGPFDNKSVLEQVMAWRRTGNKPLPEPVLTQLTDIYSETPL